MPVLTDSLLAQFAVPATWSSGEQPEDSTQLEKPFFDDAIFNEFVDEQQSVFTTIEALILKFENQPDKEILDELKRVFHTLKGEARVFGLTDIEKLCHNTEEHIESSEISIECLLEIKDWLFKKILFLSGGGSAPGPVETLNWNNKPAIKPIEPIQSKKQSDELVFKPMTLNEIGDMTLLADFVGEAEEHLQVCNENLLIITLIIISSSFCEK